MINIAVLVSGGGTNLGALIKACDTGLLKSGRLCLVVSSNPSAYALERAEKKKKKKVVLQRKGKTPEEYGDEICAVLKSENIDLVVLAGFMCILGGTLLEEYRNRIINVHPSLIPSFCGEGFYGLRVHEAALAYGVKVSGATVHIVTDVVDGGKILKQKAVDVLPDDTAETLQRRIMTECEQIILPEAVEELCACMLLEKQENF